MSKKNVYKGKSIEELKEMNLEELSELFSSRQRRSLKKGFTKQQKKLLNKIRNSGDRPVKTHVRDMIILPEMIGKIMMIYNGKEYAKIEIKPEMIGHYLGEFSQTRANIKHSSPGFGATRSSKFVPLK